MRHNKNFNHLGRQSAHRKAMLANMATSLIVHKRISTTVAKAKALKRYVEPVITRSKDDSTHSRRVAFSYLRDKNAVTELFRIVGPAIGDRPGGYTRILKTGFRLGDAADMCIIELVDFNETYKKEESTGKGRTRRRRGGSGSKKSETAPKAQAEAVPAVEAVTEETPQVEPAAEAVETAPATEEAPAVEEPAAEEAPVEEAPAEQPATEEPKAE